MAKQNAAPGGIAGVVAPLVEPITAELSLNLWDIRFVKEGATWILRVVIDRELTRPEHFAYYEGYPVTLKFYRPDDNGQKELAGLLVAWEDGFTIETEEGETLTFDKKLVAAVHAIDVWDDEEA